MSDQRKNRRESCTPEKTSAADDDLMTRGEIWFRGVFAEADLRGMSPLAVFYEWLDDLHVKAPPRAADILAKLPPETRVAYREWQRGPASASGS